MSIRKSILALAGFALCASPVLRAQDKVEGTLAADVVSQYIWRGTDCGSMALQPALGLVWKRLSLTAWGSVGITSAKDTRELDLTLGYGAGGFSVGLTDYWFSSGTETMGRYFQYGHGKTNHIFEAFAGYDFGPVRARWFTSFAGNDGTNNDGKRAYSSYFELEAPFRLVGCDWTATVGAVPYATTLYGTTGFAVTNVTLKAAKEFRIRDKVDMPVFAALTANPRTEHMYLTFGFSVRPRL